MKTAAALTEFTDSTAHLATHHRGSWLPNLKASIQFPLSHDDDDIQLDRSIDLHFASLPNVSPLLKYSNLESVLPFENRDFV